MLPRMDRFGIPPELGIAAGTDPLIPPGNLIVVIDRDRDPGLLKALSCPPLEGWSMDGIDVIVDESDSSMTHLVQQSISKLFLASTARIPDSKGNERSIRIEPMISCIR